jgi:hypothetical protein
MSTLLVEFEFLYINNGEIALKEMGVMPLDGKSILNYIFLVESKHMSDSDKCRNKWLQDYTHGFDYNGDVGTSDDVTSICNQYSMLYENIITKGLEKTNTVKSYFPMSVITNVESIIPYMPAYKKCDKTLNKEIFCSYHESKNNSHCTAYKLSILRKYLLPMCSDISHVFTLL